MHFRPALGLLVSPLIIASAALAQGAVPVHSFDIAAQPLDQALNALARQSGAQIVFATALTEGKAAPALRGSFSTAQALARLLAGSALVAQARDERTFTVVPAPLPAAALPAPADAQLPAVKAQASRSVETATGPVPGYRATRSATGTKTDTLLIDTPVSVQTISRELMDDQQVHRVKDAITNVSGVYQSHGPDGNTMDAFIVRGFAVDSYGASYLDGVKDFSRAPKETAGLERIEVLKGPAAIMYGRIEPGGMINRVGKRPQAEALTTLAQEVGTDKHFRTTLDSTGALNADATWRYRVNAVTVEEDGFIHDTHNRRVYLAPQFEWQPSASTSVRLGLEYVRDKRSWAMTYGTIGDADGPVDIPVRTNLFGRDEFYRDESTTLKLDWTHRLDATWQLQQRISYGKRRGNAQGSGLSSADAVGNYTRDYWGWNGEHATVAATNLEVLGTPRLAGVKHSVLAGVDFFDEDYDAGGWSYGGTPVTSNTHAPNHDTSYRDDFTTTDYYYRNRNTGVYLQDQFALLDERLHLLLGVRYDKAENTYHWDTTTFTPVDEKATWRAGLLYKLQPTLSVYASYVTGFGSPQYDWVTGSPFPPQTSKQVELGLKYEPYEGFGATATLFHLVKDNLTMADPDNALRTILAGEATSRGVELDVSGRVTRDWSVVAAYAFTDVKYTRSDQLQGERIAGVPRHGASLWNSVQFGASGWRAGLGLVWRSHMQGVQRAYSPDLYPYTLGGYTLVNAMLAYEFRLAGHEAKAQLNANNLGNKRYNPTTYGGTDRIGLGEPRSVVGSLSVSF